MHIKNLCQDKTVNLAMDTINIGKQAIVFCSSKRAAEKQAEDISKKSILTTQKLTVLAEEFENALGNPTKQCKRGAKCIRKGIAFHHAGLVTKQRNLIEDAFRAGTIKIICSTPTLAAGLDMPAFRTILRDLKRYSGKWGMQYIPVLEYEQMAGRAGRPGKEEYGEAIAISSNESDKEKIKENYINGEVEDIQSKLAAEPVLRTYVLSLIATNFIKTKSELITFFKKTFYAHQYGDMNRLESIIEKVIDLLKHYSFLTGTTTNFTKEIEFESAYNITEDEQLKATRLGKRVSELYLDPYTAHNILTALNYAKTKNPIPNIYIGLTQMLTDTIEMEPLIRVKTQDIESLQIVLAKFEESLLKKIPNEYSFEFDDFLRTIKTTLFFKAWMDEVEEETLLERFNIRPGETRAKLDNIDWLIRCTIELAKIDEKTEFISDLSKLAARIKYGVKEELLPILKLKGVGRVRARSLFNNGFKNLGDFTPESFEKVKETIGNKLAENIYNQLGKKIKRNDLTDFI